MPNGRGYLTAAEARALRALPPRKCAREGCPNMAKIEQRLTGLFCSASCSVTVTMHKVHKAMGYSSNVPPNFFSTWSQEMAYVLGFIVSDGHLRRRGGVVWEMTLAITDWETLDQIASLWPPTKVRPGRPLRPIPNIYRKQVFSLDVSDPEACEQLVGAGVQVWKKSYLQEFPKVPSEFIWHFLRGYTDGGGGVGIHKSTGYPWVNWKSASKNLLEGVQKVVGPATGSDAKVGGSISRGSFSVGNVTYRLQYFNHKAVKFFNLLYRDAKIYMRRKFELVKSFLSPEVLASVADLGLMPPKPIWVDRKAVLPQESVV